MTLHNLEKKLLLALAKRDIQTINELKEITGMDLSSVDHAAAWLMAKNMVKIDEKKEQKIEIGDEGRKYLDHGFPEREAFEFMAAKPVPVAEAQKKMGAQRANIAISWLARQGIVKIENGSIVVTNEAKHYLKDKFPQEEALEKISQGKPISEDLKRELIKRGDILIVKEILTRTIQLTPEGKEQINEGVYVEEEVSQLTPELIKGEKWKKIKLRKYDVEMPVKKIHIGKRHLVCQAVDYAKKVWTEMGFKEMRGPLIDTEFWNFDALYVPQNHPAREMQDTIFIDGEGELPSDELVKRVKKAHEVGVNGSTGWRYEWSEKVAARRILRPHTSMLSTHVLAELKKDDWPAKYFAVGRCFRNETVDWKHGFEFNQSEGIVVDPNANFRNHIAYLRQFYTKMGYPQARFKPAYYPYTEMSLIIEIFNSKQNRWVEIGGSGIFRPEVTEPLLGEPIPVLAWGPGFDRAITEYYNIEHFGEVYKNDIKQLREIKQWMM